MNIAGRLTETLTVKRLTSRTVTGDGVRGTTIAMPARIERGSASVGGIGGEALDNVSRVFTLAPVLLTDHLYFPEDSGQDNARRPTRVETMRGLDGVITHYETTV